MPSVLAACVVTQLRRDPGTIGITGIDKRAVTGPIKVGRYGLYADVQADRKHHGGLEQAVYVYAQEDATFWESELDRELWPGWFGENLRVEGIDINASRVGERWHVGSAILEVTRPRTPCGTFARWVAGEHAKGWVKRFDEARRPGTYFSVAKTGRISAGDLITVEPAPLGAPTILDVYKL
jgi:MOSC domain-containing protein YiiM